jgi:signal transduction histidine kinase
MIVTAALATALTVIVSLAPDALAYHAPQGHVAVETAAALVSLLVAFILAGRFLQTGRAADLMLFVALALIGTANVLFAVVPAASGSGFSRWATWSALGGRLLGAFLVVLAAFMRDSRVRDPRAAIAPALVAVAGALTAIGVTAAFLQSSLPLGIDPSMSPESAGLIVGNAGILTVQLIQTFLYAAAAIGFMRRATRTDDRLMVWFAIAAVLYAFAALNYFLFPSLYSEWLYVGDFLRLGFFLVLLVGAAMEIQHYQSELTRAVALEERRRLARELHDGLAQELAFIATQSRFLSRRVNKPADVEQLVVAAERALDESRSAISALTRPLDEPLDAALAQAAEDVAGRVGVRLKLDLAEGVEVPPSTREALVRIVREAVSNTARHGKANVVTVQLLNSDGVRLRVGDDGIGFDPSERDGRGFGLTSMTERARALGGELSISSTPGAGTQIEVVLR